MKLLFIRDFSPQDTKVSKFWAQSANLQVTFF